MESWATGVKLCLKNKKRDIFQLESSLYMPKSLRKLRNDRRKWCDELPHLNRGIQLKIWMRRWYNRIVLGNTAFIRTLWHNQAIDVDLRWVFWSPHGWREVSVSESPRRLSDPRRARERATTIGGILVPVFDHPHFITTEKVISIGNNFRNGIF